MTQNAQRLYPASRETDGRGPMSAETSTATQGPGADGLCAAGQPALEKGGEEAATETVGMALKTTGLASAAAVLVPTPTRERDDTAAAHLHGPTATPPTPDALLCALSPNAPLASEAELAWRVADAGHSFADDGSHVLHSFELRAYSAHRELVFGMLRLRYSGFAALREALLAPAALPEASCAALRVLGFPKKLLWASEDDRCARGKALLAWLSAAIVLDGVRRAPELLVLVDAPPKKGDDTAALSPHLDVELAWHVAAAGRALAADGSHTLYEFELRAKGSGHVCGTFKRRYREFERLRDQLLSGQPELAVPLPKKHFWASEADLQARARGLLEWLEAALSHEAVRWAPELLVFICAPQGRTLASLRRRSWWTPLTPDPRRSRHVGDAENA